jgi:hypothetical protein
MDVAAQRVDDNSDHWPQLGLGIHGVRIEWPGYLFRACCPNGSASLVAESVVLKMVFTGEMTMTTLIISIGIAFLIIGGYLWARKAWPDITAQFWALAGNSRTILVAFAVELLGSFDELKLLDVSAWLGSERAGRVMVIMGLVMIGLRLVTRTAVSWRSQ